MVVAFVETTWIHKVMTIYFYHNTTKKKKKPIPDNILLVTLSTYPTFIALDFNQKRLDISSICDILGKRNLKKKIATQVNLDIHCCIFTHGLNFNYILY